MMNEEELKSILLQYNNEHKDSQISFYTTNDISERVNLCGIIYAKQVIKGRWLELEPMLIQNPILSIRYAQEVIKGRWIEAEQYIHKEPYYIVQYTQDVIKERWLEIEEILQNAQDLQYWNKYLMSFPDAQDYDDNTPCVIYDVAISDISNKITNEQLKQLVKILFKEQLDQINVDLVIYWLTKFIEGRVMCNKYIKELIEQEHVTTFIDIETIKNLSFEEFCEIFKIFCPVYSDFN